LAELDPLTAERLAPNDAQRIQRALEVHGLTGRPLSSHLSRHDNPGAEAAVKGAANHRLISLEPTSRAWLHARIGQRFEAMLSAGLVAEVEALRARGDLHLDLPSIRCVGYRQTWEALDAGLSGAALREHLLERGAAASRQLAKRQLTWLRSMECVRIAADAPSAFSPLLAEVKRLSAT
jgi:tRNA dimethylallyltransferase